MQLMRYLVLDGALASVLQLTLPHLLHVCLPPFCRGVVFCLTASPSWASRCQILGRSSAASPPESTVAAYTCLQLQRLGSTNQPCTKSHAGATLRRR